MPQARSECCKTRMHLSAILVPHSLGPVWHLAATPMTGRRKVTDQEKENEESKREREKKAEGERAGRRKRPRQDVGSCLPAGG